MSCRVFVCSVAVGWALRRLDHLSVDTEQANLTLPELRQNRWCNSAENEFGGYCRKGGFTRPEECFAIDIPGTRAIQFRDGGCDFYQLEGNPPTNCPQGYHAGRGTTTTSYKTVDTHYTTIFCKLVVDADTTRNRWCNSAENKFGGYCRKGGFTRPHECFAIDIPGTRAIQFRDGGCDFYQLEGNPPTNCPQGYHAGRGTTTTSYKTVDTHYTTIFCKLVVDADTTRNRWCNSAENKFGGYCRKVGFTRPHECFAIDIPGTRAIQFRGGECDFYQLEGNPPTNCPQGYHAGRGTTTTSYKTVDTHHTTIFCRLVEDVDTTRNRWCNSAENKFGGYCRKGGFTRPDECFAIDIPGTRAIQFRDGGCDFYQLEGNPPTNCPQGYHAGRGTTTTSYKTVDTHYTTIFCKIL